MLFLAFRDGDQTRRRILAAIAQRPSLNKSELCEAVGLAWNTVGHHLRILSKRGLVKVAYRGWDHGVFAATVPVSHRGWLRALHDPDCARVLRELLRDNPLGVYELSNRLGHSHKVIRRHLNRLIDDGVAERLGEARPRYRLLQPPPDLPLHPVPDLSAGVPELVPRQ
jgi:DNA-binding transcriptional ArsR family regulator